MEGNTRENNHTQMHKIGVYQTVVIREVINYG